MDINIVSFIFGMVAAVALEAVVLCAIALSNVRRSIQQEEQKDGKARTDR